MSLLPLHGLQPTRLLCPWDFPGKILEWVAISYSEYDHFYGAWQVLSCCLSKIFYQKHVSVSTYNNHISTGSFIKLFFVDLLHLKQCLRLALECLFYSQVVMATSPIYLFTALSLSHSCSLSQSHKSHGILYKYVCTLHVEVLLLLCIIVFILAEMSEKETLT